MSIKIRSSFPWTTSKPLPAGSKRELQKGQLQIYPPERLNDCHAWNLIPIAFTKTNWSLISNDSPTKNKTSRCFQLEKLYLSHVYCFKIGLLSWSNRPSLRQILSTHPSWAETHQMHSDTTGDFMWFLRLTWDHCVSHVAIPFSTTIEIEKSMDHDNITSGRISLGLCTNHQGRWSARREPAPEVSAECCWFFLDTEWHGLGMMCVSSYTHACHKQVRPYMYSTMMRIILSNQRYFNTLGEKSHGTWRSWLTTLGSRLWIGSIYIRGQAWARATLSNFQPLSMPPRKESSMFVGILKAGLSPQNAGNATGRIWKLESNTGLTFTLDKHSWMLVDSVASVFGITEPLNHQELIGEPLETSIFPVDEHEVFCGSDSTCIVGVIEAAAKARPWHAGCCDCVKCFFPFLWTQLQTHTIHQHSIKKSSLIKQADCFAFEDLHSKYVRVKKYHEPFRLTSRDN